MGSEEDLKKQETKAKKAAYYQRNREKVLAAVNAYRIENKDFISARNKARYQKNKLLHKAKRKIYYENNKEKHLKKCMEYHFKNRDVILQKMRDRYQREKPYRISKQKAYYQENKEKVKAKAKTFRELNKESLRKISKDYRWANIDKVRAHDRERSKKRWRDPVKKEKHKLWRLNNLQKVKDSVSKRHDLAISTLGGRCAKCGYSDRREILQFDHIDRTTKIKMGKRRVCKDRWNGVLSRPNVFQLLCPNCHAIKTSLEIQSKDFSEYAEEYWTKRLGLIMEFGSCCAHCAYDENTMAFHFDHRNGLCGEKRQPAVVCVKKNPEAFDLLCANCHAVKTLSDRKKSVI